MPERRIGFVLLVDTSPTSLTGITRAGKILWPILLGEQDATAAPAATAAVMDSARLDTLDLPSVRDVVAKMRASAGGERNLLAHATLELRAEKHYLNQGVDAELRVQWAAPDRMVTDEAWKAVGRSIGRVRVYCDGTLAGQETTFGQDETYSGAGLERARQDAALMWLARPDSLLPRLRLIGRQRVAGEDAYVLQRALGSGDSTRYAVSARSFLIVRKSGAGTVETYSDFRNVGGVVRPFRTTIADELGESEVVVREIRFDAPLPAAAFEPRVASAAPRAAAGP
jgi:hypothetical protein